MIRVTPRSQDFLAQPRTCVVQTSKCWLHGLRCIATFYLLHSCSPAPADKPLVWQPAHFGTIAAAQLAQRPVLIAFSAKWCGACQRFDKEVWPHPQVRSAAAGFTAVRVDLTQRSDETARLAETYGVESLPMVIFIDSTGQVLAQPRIRTFLMPHVVAKLLKQVH